MSLIGIFDYFYYSTVEHKKILECYEWYNFKVVVYLHIEKTNKHVLLSILQYYIMHFIPCHYKNSFIEVTYDLSLFTISTIGWFRH